MGKIMIINGADFSTNKVGDIVIPSSIKELLLSSTYMNNLSKTSYNGLGTWISGALAKAYFANNKHIKVSYIYIRPSTTLTTLTLTLYNVPDEDTTPTSAGIITIPIDSSMVDTSKGINGLYKVPVNIDLNGTLISLGSDNIYFDNIVLVSESEEDNAGYWPISSSWSDCTDRNKHRPIGIGYVITL